MNNLQHILQQLFRKDSLEEVPVTQLEQLVEEHPLFAPAQFLLAKKYKETGNESYKKQIQKTALHFHNPLWLHYHLTEKQPASDVLENKSAPAVIISTPAETTTLSHDLIEEVVTHQEATPGAKDDSSLYTISTEPGYISDAETKNGVDDAHIGEMYHTNETSEALKEAESRAAMNRHEGDNDSDGDDTTAPPLDIKMRTGSGFQVPGESSHGSPGPEKDEHKQPLVHPIFNKANDEEQEESKPAFEPFHTVDYFASQGIKVNQDLKPEDRLGKQMKSFTEWLKTMRKLPAASVEEELEKINDREIVTIAEHSLEEKEVVTEAMAEVLAKQGLHRQAADVYRKLSLLNPGKSSYFAAKIEDLKNH